MFMHTKLQNMEESSYVPNSIPPSLVVFSQAGYGDTIRMQRPFASQDGKDLNLTNLSPSSFGLRHMESYGGLPAQLVHLQNPFLHPALEARLPFGSTGAFRPVVTSSTSSTPTSTSSADERISVKGLSSAFTAANLVNNRRKLDSIVESVIEQQHHQSGRSRGSGGAVASSQSQQNEQNAYSQQASASAINLDKSSSSASAAAFMNGGQSRHRSSSPSNINVHAPNSSPSVKQEERDRDRADDCGGDDRDGNGTPNSDVTERSTPEDAHPSKRRRNFGEVSCPVCKMSLHPVDMESHLLSEVEQLMCLSRMHRQQQRRDEPLASSSSTDSSSNAIKKEGPVEMSQDSRWETYQRVRVNRHSRLRLKTRRRREESGGNGGPHVTCPVCQIPLQGPAEQLSGHVEACLRKQDGRYHNGDMLDEDEPVDIEGDGDGDGHDMDEYDWMRSRRHNIRPHHDSSGNYPLAALNMTTSRRREEENDTMEVVVDGDDTSTYGYTQYTEADIHAAMNRTESRSPTPARNQDGNSDGSRWEDRESPVNSSCASDDGSSDQLGGNVNHKMVIQALKHRVRELEKDTKSSTYNGGNHCLVCKDKYKKPVVSISCWHVHCELCWLRSLGSKKLCPQCNMITSAADLRRVFF